MDRFVVGTGRCGSTLLSRMLGRSPEVCSIFEFFTGLDRSSSFDPGDVDGAALGELLAKCQPVLNEVLVRGYDVVEVTYPFDSDGSRFSRSDVPWLASTMLPRLTDSPDALFDELLAFARAQPERPRGLQYRALFDWLADRTGGRVWVERSGSSIEYVGHLADLFPDPRFVHIHRDGREAALSMREHAAYRLAVGLLYADRIPAPDAAVGDVTGDDADFITATLEAAPPPELYGRYWSDQLAAGFEAMADIDAFRYHAVRFEDLVADPGPVLEGIAEFFELDIGDWVADASKLLHGRPATRFETLGSVAAGALVRACEPGMRRLGRR